MKMGIFERLMTHAVLITGAIFILFPVYIAFVGSTHDAATIGRGLLPLFPGPYFVSNYLRAWNVGTGGRVISVPVKIMLVNSLITALLVATGKVLLSSLTAYALVYFRFPLQSLFFWAILVTLMLPLEVRIFPSYKVASNLKLLNTYWGLSLPLLVSATGTLLLRQAFRSIPRELFDAAQVDGAGPFRCFWQIALPTVRPNLAALFIIMFIYGWNQYLWPLLITTKVQMQTIVIGLVRMMGGPEALVDWDLVMATAVMAMTVPVLVAILAQRWLIRGLTESEK
ncbi:sn-glycerol-3-phosphate ABC transporter permease UgpE [Candidatus Bipolaricaulota bacterium]|nr:sn-glycerol-3-phosphate ABC transporter permease UgpE [Candidatus Bipolaricaulota bacterium]